MISPDHGTTGSSACECWVERRPSPHATGEFIHVKHTCRSCSEWIIFAPDQKDPQEDYIPKKHEDPKPDGFDHTKFSRRKRR